MNRLRTETCVLIDAPLALVWDVMLDVERYSEWNPFVTRIEGITTPAQPGQRMRLHVRWKDGSGVVSNEEIVRVEGPSPQRSHAVLEYAFRGPLDALYLVRGSRVQTLEAVNETQTRYRTEEQFRGLLALFVPIANVQDGFERHAKALKQRSEQLYRAASTAHA